MTRVLLAGLFHETHTFLEGRSGPEVFAVTDGDALLQRRGDGSPFDGFLEVADAEGWEVVPAIDARAMPGPTVSDDVVRGVLRGLRQHATRALVHGVDAVYLVLHGAMVSEELEDVEGELLRDLRSVLGYADLPIFGVFDLHANVSHAMTTHSTGLVAYRENPHTDARTAAVRAARLLARALREPRPVHSYRRSVPIVWPPTGTGTGQDPMRALEAMARDIEARDTGVWAVNVVPGFAFADVSDTGLSFTIVGTLEEAKAHAHLDVMAATAWRLRREGVSDLPNAHEVLRRILPIERGPVVLAEPSDNIGAGAPGDGTGLLRALLEHPARSALVVLNDPAAVASLGGLALGEHRALALGGHGSRLDPGPVRLEVSLLSRSDGRFRLEDPQSHLASMTGMHVDMGHCAVVRSGAITLLLTSRKTPPFDLGQLRSQGLEPTSFDILAVKAAVAHRRAYDPIATAHYTVDTPGPCTTDLTRLPYARIRRPVFPLDPMPNNTVGVGSGSPPEERP